MSAPESLDVLALHVFAFFFFEMSLPICAFIQYTFEEPLVGERTAPIQVGVTGGTVRILQLLKAGNNITRYLALEYGGPVRPASLTGCRMAVYDVQDVLAPIAPAYDRLIIPRKLWSVETSYQQFLRAEEFVWQNALRKEVKPLDETAWAAQKAELIVEKVESATFSLGSRSLVITSKTNLSYDAK
jgi:hypothetical protein